MENLIKILSINDFWQIIFTPFIELNQEINNIIDNRHKIRSIFKIIIAVIVSIMSIYFSLKNYQIINSFNILIEIFNFSNQSRELLTKLMDIVFCCHVGIFCGKFFTQIFCKYRYGDPEFYLTTDRLLFLQENLQESAPNITVQEIKEVVNFCIKNLRQENLNHLAGTQRDWKKTIEELIYDVDLEAFYQQQEAFYAKKAQLDNLKATLSKKILENKTLTPKPNYGSTNNDFDGSENLPRAQTLVASSFLEDYNDHLEESIVFLPKVTLTRPYNEDKEYEYDSTSSQSTRKNFNTTTYKPRANSV